MDLRALIVAGLALAFVAAAPAMAMEIESASISDGVFSKESGCADLGGRGLSPQIAVTDVPEGTEYLAIVLDDPDAKPLDGKTWVHWNVVNIPGDHTRIAAGERPRGDVLPNSDEDESYGGLCPEDGRHTYRLAVFALEDIVDAQDFDELTVEDFRDEFDDIILDEAMVRAAYP
ncbi:MAG: YbhB/YbcL family Raf kinase inhibitor-like protein [Rhodospirillaceae bacterium]|nr:YbhB/YbcL family Raf kinase inhibitor-like protein [Rhodospirillaceae bacterium]